jgi:hypothetical protein
MVALGIVAASSLCAAAPEERQITFSPKNHNLDNNDNFSPDGRFLVYDTRETVGPGIENSQSIEMVEIATGRETVLYAAHPTVIGEQAAPGTGAATFHPVANKVAFIHGPFLQEVPFRGWYAKPNRLGAEVDADGSMRLQWLDVRDVATDRDTIAGAHRGGTHRHEYTLDGKRVGFTYDDFLLPEYGRTVGFMVPHPKAPSPASHYFALLVPVAPTGKSKPGEIEVASGDSWIGKHGYMRAFIGKVREADGSYMESLFVVDVPADVDITTADAGSATRYPKPPKGVSIRRLTHTPASGTVRGTVEGDRIAYYATADDGTKQVFIIASDGSDQDPDPAKRPVQATRLPKGVTGGVRWHPSGNSILCMSNGGIAATCVKPGPDFGKSVFLTPEGDLSERIDPVLSPDGKVVAYGRVMPTQDVTGRIVKNYKGLDFVQLFVVDFPDSDGDGIVD